MNTKQIEYILELAQTGNFNKAAANLYISQPTMTYQIRAVEEEIGFRIFERSGKGCTLTPAGSQFVISLKNIYNDLKTAIWAGQNFSSRFRQDIRNSKAVVPCSRQRRALSCMKIPETPFLMHSWLLMRLDMTSLVVQLMSSLR